MFYMEIMLKYVLWNQTVFACFMDQVQREFDEVFLLDYRLVAPPQFSTDYIESMHKVLDLLRM